RATIYRSSRSVKLARVLRKARFERRVGINMEETGKRRLNVAGTVAAGIVYFLVCAFPLQKELVLVPGWTRSLLQAPAAPAASSKKSGSVQGSVSTAPLPFRLGGSFGYFTP